MLVTVAPLEALAVAGLSACLLQSSAWFYHLLLPPQGWASSATTPTWPGVKTACSASRSSSKLSWISSRVASNMTWKNTAIRCTMAYVSVCWHLFALCFSKHFVRCSMSSHLSDLSKASEKMLKAWQENEERAAAFAQVTHLLKIRYRLVVANQLVQALSCFLFFPTGLLQ